MKRLAVVALGGVLLLLLGLLAIPVVFMGGAASAAGTCGATGSGSAPSAVVAAGLPSQVGAYSGEQITNAAAIIAAGAALNVSPRGQAIAVMTAMGESGLRVLNYGDGAGPDSRGLFQQRDNGAWGSLSDRMNPTISATNFYKALLRVDGWETLPPTIAAHRTQINADPYYYEKFWDGAVAMLKALSGLDLSAAAGAAGADASICDVPVITDGAEAFPLPAGSGFVDQNNYGGTGSHWANIHTGDDLSVACGTPVLAAHAGTVILRGHDGGTWAGPNFVQVTQGPGRLTTWYAHMRSVTVSDGQVVAAGQQLGEVGDLGNATGCHLHFEIHPSGGGYNTDQINPESWLQALLAKGGATS